MRNRNIYLLSNKGLEGTACTELPDFDDSQSWTILEANYKKNFYECPNVSKAMVMAPTFSGVTQITRQEPTCLRRSANVVDQY